MLCDVCAPAHAARFGRIPRSHPRFRDPPPYRKWLPHRRKVIYSEFGASDTEDVSYHTEDVLSEHDLQLLLRFTKDAAPKWREIGLALGFSMGVLDAIAAKLENTSRGPVACFSDLLSRWLKFAPPKHRLPTPELLAEALREDTVGEERMALDLTQEFQCKSGVFLPCFQASKST